MRRKILNHESIVESVFDSVRHQARWSHLRAFGTSRLLATSYFWFLAVPVAAKAVEVLPETVEIGGAVFRLDFGLPFSWVVFYFSAVAFALAGLVFTLSCPRIVLDHVNAREFLDSGKTDWHVLMYRREFDDITGSIDPNDDLSAMFWGTYEDAVKVRPRARFACLWLYWIGLALFGWVAFQNIVFVAGVVL